MSHYAELIEKQPGLHAFVLAGEDTFGRERARSAIAAALDAAGSGPLTPVRYDSTVESFSLFVQKMLSPSLFADRRLFQIRHAQSIAVADLQELAESALSMDLPDVYIIIEIDGDKKDITKVLKKLESEKHRDTMLYEEFPRPRDWEIADWLVANVPRLTGRRIGKPEAEYLAGRVGFDLDTLHSEVQKIDLHLPQGAVIDRAAIDLITETMRERDPFELAAAVGRKDFAAVLETINALFIVNTYTPLMIAALARHFWSLFRIARFFAANPGKAQQWVALRGRKSQAQTDLAMEIGKAGGILRDGQQGRVYPAIIKSGVVEQAASFTGAELSRIIAWLLEFDAGYKTGRFEPTQQALQVLCFKIIRVRSLIQEGAAA